jgi:predicted GNAT superfamily acetyltransferase
MSDRLTIRDLHTLPEFHAVVRLQREIWGLEYDDVVPLSMLAVAAKTGGILVGAFDRAGEMSGFVFSVPAVQDGRAHQWSHMLGVVPARRGAGLGHHLKLAQRERALAMAMDLIEWTYDPLLVTNAHLNVRRLGVVVERYLENVYGASTSPLHHGAPTDRFVASWRIATPHVQRRVAADPAAAAGRGGAPIVLRDSSVRDTPIVLATTEQGGFRAPAGRADLALDAPRLFVEIPPRYLEMLASATDLAVEWRLVTREVFQTLFARGYRVVDFTSDRSTGRAGYLLRRQG